MKIGFSKIKKYMGSFISPKEENFLWVSSEKGFYLILDDLSPPQTSEPKNNPYHSMIDAQLTTEIFGTYQIPNDLYFILGKRGSCFFRIAPWFKPPQL